MNKKLTFVIFFTVVIDVIGIGIIIPLLSFYAEYFGASPVTITLLFSCFSLMQFLFAPFWGSLSDRFGRKPILLLSLAGSCLSYLWCGLATSLWMLFASRLLAGFMGGTVVTAQALMSDITTVENRAKGMGIIGASFGLGFTFGPAMGGILAGVNTDTVNYQLPFFVASALSLAGFIFAFFALPLSLPSAHSSSTKKISKSISFKKRLFNFVNIFKLPIINVLIIVFFLIGMGLVGCQTILALWLERQFSWQPQQLGYLLMYCGIIATFFQGGAIGFLNKKYGEVNLLFAGLTILAIGLFLFPLIENLILLLGAMSCLTIGENLCKTCARSIISQLSPAEETGTILGIAQSATSFGTIIGPSLAGFAFLKTGISSPFVNAGFLVLMAIVICLPISSKMYLKFSQKGKV